MRLRTRLSLSVPLTSTSCASQGLATASLGPEQLQAKQQCENEIWKYDLSTGKTHGEVLQNLLMSVSHCWPNRQSATGFIRVVTHEGSLDAGLPSSRRHDLSTSDGEAHQKVLFYPSTRFAGAVAVLPHFVRKQRPLHDLCWSWTSFGLLKPLINALSQHLHCVSASIQLKDGRCRQVQHCLQNSSTSRSAS